MSRAKKIFVVLFLTVCAFGVYESFFPSKIPVDPNAQIPTVSPSPTPTPAK